MSNHSPEPWRRLVLRAPTQPALLDTDGRVVLFISQCGGGDKERLEADLSRIAACVNFCGGVSEEQMAAGLGEFVMYKLARNKRFITAEVGEAIETLRGVLP